MIHIGHMCIQNVHQSKQHGGQIGNDDILEIEMSDTIQMRM